MLVGDDPEAVGLLDDADAGAPAWGDVPLSAEEADLVCLCDDSLVMDR